MKKIYVLVLLMIIAIPGYAQFEVPLDTFKVENNECFQKVEKTDEDKSVSEWVKFECDVRLQEMFIHKTLLENITLSHGMLKQGYISQKAFNEILNAVVEAQNKVGKVAYKDIVKYLKTKFIQLQKKYPVES